MLTPEVSDEPTRVVTVLRKGSYFGEVALVVEDSRRRASVVAFSNSALYRLHKHAIDPLVQVFPELALTLQRQAERFVKSDQERASRREATPKEDVGTNILPEPKTMATGTFATSHLSIIGRSSQERSSREKGVPSAPPPPDDPAHQVSTCANVPASSMQRRATSASLAKLDELRAGGGDDVDAVTSSLVPTSVVESGSLGSGLEDGDTSTARHTAILEELAHIREHLRALTEHCRAPSNAPRS